MARERGTSLLHSYEGAASFFGPRVPDVVRKMAPNVSKMNKGLLRKLVQVAIRDIEESEVPENALQTLKAEDIPDELLMTTFAGILMILKLAFRMPPGALKKEIFVKEIAELKIPEEFIEDLTSVIFSSKQQTIDEKVLENRIRLPRLDSLRWRVDVGISTSVLNRVLEPTILMEMKLDDGKTETFEVMLPRRITSSLLDEKCRSPMRKGHLVRSRDEVGVIPIPTIHAEKPTTDNCKEVPVSKFHELRYNVASVLKEMEDLEKRSILKIQT